MRGANIEAGAAGRTAGEGVRVGVEVSAVATESGGYCSSSRRGVGEIGGPVQVQVTVMVHEIATALTVSISAVALMLAVVALALAVAVSSVATCVVA